MNKLSTKVRTSENAKFETDMKECIAELLALAATPGYDEIMYEIGAILLRMGAIPRNYRIKQERRGAYD